MSLAPRFTSPPHFADLSASQTLLTRQQVLYVWAWVLLFLDANEAGGQGFATVKPASSSAMQGEHIFEDGEWAVMEWSFGGTFRGEFAGYAPTGRRFMLRGCECFHVTDGKIRFQRGCWHKAFSARLLAQSFMVQTAWTAD